MPQGSPSRHVAVQTDVGFLGTPCLGPPLLIFEGGCSIAIGHGWRVTRLNQSCHSSRHLPRCLLKKVTVSLALLRSFIGGLPSRAFSLLPPRARRQSAAAAALRPPGRPPPAAKSSHGEQPGESACRPPRGSHGGGVPRPRRAVTVHLRASLASSQGRALARTTRARLLFMSVQLEFPPPCSPSRAGEPSAQGVRLGRTSCPRLLQGEVCKGDC